MRFLEQEIQRQREDTMGWEERQTSFNYDQDPAKRLSGPTPPVASILTRGTCETLCSMLEGETAVTLEPFWPVNLTLCHICKKLGVRHGDSPL